MTQTTDDWDVFSKEISEPSQASSADQDWDAFVEETAIDSASVTFPLTPDEAAEDPEAHVQKVRFTKTPAFLWMLITGGFVGLVLMIYGATSYITGSRKVVAAAPSETNVFDESNKGGKEILPSAPEESGVEIASPPPSSKGNKKVTKTVTLRQPRTSQPPGVVYVNRPSQGFTPSARSFNPSRAVSLPALRPLSRPTARPVLETSPQPLPEPMGALYAPESGEGPQIETEAIASTPVKSTPSQSNNAAVDEALAIYDGTKTAQADPSASTATFASEQQVVTTSAEVKTAPAEVAIASAEVQTTPSAQEPERLTSEEYSKKYPQKAAKEALLARLAMIPQESTLKGQIMGMLSWASQDSFPVGQEIKIKVRSDFEQFGKVLIPKGSIAIAQSQEGTMGQYIMASVTRIETPDGRSIDIEPGMLSASSGDGFIEGKLKEPHRGGGIGRVAAQVGQGILNFGVAAVVPEGDEFGDRVVQNIAGLGLDAVNNSIGGNRRVNRAQGQVPSFYIVKPKTSISLVANGDIQLQEAN